ncbi:uncharacterized protein LOC131486714 [Neofelis nebulosa]|uniref:uncharacterized protein LOC131486714 n=1 Tax=Neofelis nebulosa TaxID=61452 RepID=UPI002729D829|nr:uncharacterized protein LOC131486714 [Neofelis nebulosa]
MAHQPRGAAETATKPMAAQSLAPQPSLGDGDPGLVSSEYLQARLRRDTPSSPPGRPLPCPSPPTPARPGQVDRGVDYLSKVLGGLRPVQQSLLNAVRPHHGPGLTPVLRTEQTPPSVLLPCLEPSGLEGDSATGRYGPGLGGAGPASEARLGSRGAERGQAVVFAHVSAPSVAARRAHEDSPGSQGCWRRGRCSLDVGEATLNRNATAGVARGGRNNPPTMSDEEVEQVEGKCQTISSLRPPQTESSHLRQARPTVDNVAVLGDPWRGTPRSATVRGGR